jgi:hypothetical protein
MLDRIVYTDHGEEKRRKEGVSDAGVRSVLSEGMALRRYPEETPESYLAFGWLGEPARLGTYEKGRPLHVVAADDEKRRVTWIITIYEPDPNRWTDNFKWKPSWTSTENTWKQESS